jgi:hypothetical protein
MGKNKKNKNERERKERRREADQAAVASKSVSTNSSSSQPEPPVETFVDNNDRKKKAKNPIIMSLGNILYITYFVCIILIINYFAITYINYSNEIDFTQVTGPIAFLDYIFYLLKNKPKEGEKTSDTESNGTPSTQSGKKSNGTPPEPVGFIKDKVLYNSINFFKEICKDDFITFFTNYIQIAINIILYVFVYFWYTIFNFNNMTDTSTIIKLFLSFLKYLYTV